jgi:iron complex transport system ATP-binding protein
MLKVENIFFNVDGKQLLKNISFNASAGEFVVIMGMNGAGKSTLLKIIAGALKPSQGDVFIDDKNLKNYSTEKLALKRAVLSQHYEIAFPSTVYEMVMMGRYPYFNSNPTENDEAIVKECLQTLGIENFADRDYNSLSGGEAQKVQMARVLAQVFNQDNNSFKMQLLDEPVSHLDIKHQHQLLQIAKQQTTKGALVVAVLHDINLAIKYANKILLLKEGKLCYELKDKYAFTTEIIQNIFDIDVALVHHKNDNPIVVF